MLLSHALRLMHPDRMFLLLKAWQEQPQNRPCIAGNMQRGRHVLVDLCPVNIDVEHFGIRCKSRRIAQCAV